MDMENEEDVSPAVVAKSNDIEINIPENENNNDNNDDLIINNKKNNNKNNNLKEESENINRESMN